MNEVEVCYLKRNQYVSRKQKQYESIEEAIEIFNSTVKKFKNIKTEALITVRILERGLWRIYKADKT